MTSSEKNVVPSAAVAAAVDAALSKFKLEKLAQLEELKRVCERTNVDMARMDMFDAETAMFTVKIYDIYDERTSSRSFSPTRSGEYTARGLNAAFDKARDNAQSSIRNSDRVTVIAHLPNGTDVELPKELWASQIGK